MPAVLDDPADSWWATPPRLPDGSGWLVSTVDDYWAFVSLLLRRGAVGDTRLLSADAVGRA